MRISLTVSHVAFVSRPGRNGIVKAANTVIANKQEKPTASSRRTSESCVTTRQPPLPFGVTMRLGLKPKPLHPKLLHS